ncbi:LuxR family transcriptional regulator [Lentzea sp. NBRC 105346]|uniref:ATP-binding protein n=1 Tax=Lentzea sp. NBRC 105346 TaxID=3032205 RepID=UPI0024A19300|nr:LuxR family transcriptional regulator [Lentzea sp. NBRC 105346]GLZ27997.1 LuxR family transcriptional regulator [Lentzea sp. NBRC 105346]
MPSVLRVSDSMPGLVGRHAELAALHTQLHALTRGHGGVVLTIGDAGQGKSALLREVFGTRDRDHRLIWTSGDELSQVFPLLPFVEVTSGEHRAEITAVLRGGAGISDPAVVASEILVGWIDDLCSATPLVLVLDDLHWADEASVRLWNRLTRIAEQQPLLVAGSMRPGQDRADLDALVRRVAQLAAAGRGVLAELTPLSAAESAELAESMVGGPPGDRLTGLIAAAGGNPLYVTELVGAMMRDDVLSTNSAGVVEAAPGERSPSLSAVISSHLDAVAPDVRDLLRMAALFGVEFDVADLGVAAGRPIAELVGMLGRARAAGLLTTTGTGMAFRHPLIRDVLCDQVAGSVRAAWHQEVGRTLALAGQPRTAVTRQLLAAIDVGGDLPAPDWLIDWLMAQGEGLANEPAVVARTLFKHALPRLPLTDPRRVEIVAPLASALLRGGDPAEAERLARQTLDTTDTRAVSADTVLKLGLIAVDCVLLLARHGDALTLLDRLESEVDWQPRQLLRLRVMRAIACIAFVDRRDESAALAERVLAEARGLGDPWVAAHACHSLAVLNIMLSRPDLALGHADRGLAVVEDDPEQLDVYMSLLADQAFAQLELYRWEDARVSTARLRRLAERTGNERRLQQGVICDALRLYRTGGWDDLLSEVAAVGAEVPLLVCYERAVLVALHRDDTVTARHYLDVIDEILAKSRWTSQMRGRTEWLVVVRALVLEHAGDLTGALDLQREAVENLWTAADLPTANVVRLAMACDRRADAEYVVAFAEEKANPAVRPGLVAHCRGLLDHDPELLEQAARCYVGSGLVLGAAQAWEAAGLAWARRGETSNARRAMTRSLKDYDSLGAVWDVARVRAAFREHGVRTGAREPRNRPVSGWESLTVTETRVAHLVAEGLSNRLIAEQLFLSRRTVDTHVSHILAKLGLRSRVEVATLALAQPR